MITTTLISKQSTLSCNPTLPDAIMLSECDDSCAECQRWEHLFLIKQFVVTLIEHRVYTHERYTVNYLTSMSTTTTRSGDEWDCPQSWHIFLLFFATAEVQNGFCAEICGTKSKPFEPFPRCTNRNDLSRKGLRALSTCNASTTKAARSIDPVLIM